LTLSIVGVVVDTLDVSLLTDVEGKSLGEGSAVGHGAVGADTSVDEGGVVAGVLRRRSTADLGASVQLSVAPVECSGGVNSRGTKGRRSSWRHYLGDRGSGRD